MSALLATILSSADYDAVTEPYYSAADLFVQTYASQGEWMPDFVLSGVQSRKDTKDLVVKRFMWLILLRCSTPMSQYVVSTAVDPPRVERFLTWLNDEVERLFRGSYYAFDSPVGEFVAAAQVVYNS